MITTINTIDDIYKKSIQIIGMLEKCCVPNKEYSFLCEHDHSKKIDVKIKYSLLEKKESVTIFAKLCKILRDHSIQYKIQRLNDYPFRKISIYMEDLNNINTESDLFKSLISVNKYNL